MPDLWTQFLTFLSQIITPAWGDLVNLLPFGVMLLVVVFLLNTALQWRRAGAINRTRVPRPLASGVLPPGIHLPGPSRWPFVVPIGALFILLSLALRPRGPGSESAPPVNLPLLGLGLLITAVAIMGWLWDAMREWRRTAGMDRGDDHGPAVLATGAGSLAGLQAGAAPALRATLPAAMVGSSPMAVAAGGGGVTHGETAHDLPPGIHLPGPSPWPFFVPISAMFILFGIVLSPALMVGGLVMAVIAVGGWLRDAGWEYRQVDAGIAPEPRSRDPQRMFPMSLVKVYVVIAALSIGAIFAPSVVSKLITKPSASGGPAASAGASGGPPSGTLTIAAKNIAFDTDHLTAPAAKPFQIVFDNQDTVQHDVSIYAGSDATGENKFQGAIFAGPKSTTYTVPALAAGTYYFQCDVHPNMKGTLDVH